ncbi:MAG: oligosaccharide flippase family protein [Anaerolineaceae bacterium]
MLKTKILKDTVFLNLASLVGQAFKILQGFLVLKFLDPAAFGIWLSLEIVIKYSAYINLGLEHGFSNRLPYYLGQGKLEKVQQTQDTAYLAWTGITAVFMVAVLIYSAFVQNPSPIFRWGLIVIALLVLFEQQISYISRWETSGMKNFSLFSRLQVIRTVITFCLVVPLAFFFNVYGLMTGTLLAAVVMALLWWLKTRYRYHGHFSFGNIKELLRIGFPILLVVVGGVLIETVDRLLILNKLGSEQLGFYGVTVLGGGFMYGLLAQAGSAIAPHMIEDMGRMKDDPHCLEKYLVKPTLFFASASVLAILALEFVMPVLVTYWVPKYLPGLPAFTLFLPGYFFLSIVLTGTNILQIILIARNRQQLMIYIQLAAVVLEVLFGLLFLNMGWGIAGVALSSSIAYLFYGVTVLTMTSNIVLAAGRQRIRFMAEVIGLFVIGVGLYFAIEWVGQALFPGQLILKVIIQLVLCCLAGLPILFWLDWRVKIIADLVPFINNLRKKFLPGFSGKG